MSERKTLTVGLWRPDAQLICIECHESQFGRTFGFGNTRTIEDERFEEVECPVWHAVGYCEHCEKEMWVPEDIAAEQTVLRMLRENGFAGYMQQTGGMCSAVEVPVYSIDDDNYGWVWITASEDSVGEDTSYIVGYLWLEDGNMMGEDEWTEAQTPERAVEAVKTFIHNYRTEQYMKGN